MWNKRITERLKAITVLVTLTQAARFFNKKYKYKKIKLSALKCSCLKLYVVVVVDEGKRKLLV